MKCLILAIGMISVTTASAWTLPSYNPTVQPVTNSMYQTQILRNNPTPVWSYEQLMSIRLTDRDCANIDSIILQFEQQLQFRGLTGKDPESLNYDERLFNSRARSDIWSLRVGCNNPNRYKK